jgi:hypothetical protein
MLPGKPQTTERVFLSYSHSDRTAASRLARGARAAGLSVFKDDVSLRTGDRWLERLQEVLQGCSAFVVLAGRDGVRRWVGAEVQVALIRHLSPEAGRGPPADLPDPARRGAGRKRCRRFSRLFQATRWTPAEALPAGLVDAIRAHAIRLDSPPAIEGCPFVGLNAFTSKDSRLFFGRRRETLEALACLGDQQQANPEGLRAGAGSAYCRWLQIEGNSGTGKSSLVNAGMLPMIEQGALWARTGVEHWSILGPMMPGKDPLTRLAEVVEHGLISDQSRRNMLARQQVFEHNERALGLRPARFQGRTVSVPAHRRPVRRTIHLRRRGSQQTVRRTARQRPARRRVSAVPDQHCARRLPRPLRALATPAGDLQQPLQALLPADHLRAWPARNHRAAGAARRVSKSAR